MVLITSSPNFDLPFRLYTNASTLGLAAILAQVQEGRKWIICCTARALLQTENNYPATKLECFAIVQATAKLRPYLMSNEFDIYTDHYALQWLKNTRIVLTLLHSWSMVLKEFEFTIHPQPDKARLMWMG